MNFTKEDEDLVIKETSNLLEALYKGNVIKNVETYKRLQQVVNLLILVMPILMGLFPTAGNALLTILTVLSSLGGSSFLLTAITTGKIGL